MSDGPATRGGKDRTRIDVSDDHALRYWSRRLNVSREDVKRAVEKVGVLADDVVRELAGKTNLVKSGKRSPRR
jgi:hypothetical protein